MFALLQALCAVPRQDSIVWHSKCGMCIRARGREGLGTNLRGPQFPSGLPWKAHQPTRLMGFYSNGILEVGDPSLANMPMESGPQPLADATCAKRDGGQQPKSDVLNQCEILHVMTTVFACTSVARDLRQEVQMSSAS